MHKGTLSLIRIYAKGVFDLLHHGHINFLREARALGDWLTVGVTPDERATTLKRKPLFNVHHRASVIEAVRYVDEVIKDGPREITPEFMKENNFQIYAFGTANADEREFRLNDCIRLPREMIIEIPYTTGISTTHIREILRS
jgi:glycerol-3-phosphate cytidylyltransferase